MLKFKLGDERYKSNKMKGKKRKCYAEPKYIVDTKRLRNPVEHYTPKSPVTRIFHRCKSCKEKFYMKPGESEKYSEEQMRCVTCWKNSKNQLRWDNS